jgi:ABC-2 type transport system permease protein
MSPEIGNEIGQGGRHDGGARILDRGYRRFEGSRSGVAGAVRSVAWHTTRSILGLGRKGRHKVFPIVVTVIAFVPAIGFLVLAALVGDLLEGELQPEYWELFGYSIVPALLFTALVAPEAIVRDRRDGMFALYLSTPLTRPTYLLAKVTAVVGTLSIITLGPALMWLLGYTLQSLGPDSVLEWLSVAGRIVAAGLIIAALYTAVSLAAACFTDRRAFASVAVILTILGASIATGVLVESAELPDELRLFDPLSLPIEMATRLFGERGDEFAGVSTELVVVACAGWILSGAALVWGRYRRLAAV